MLVKEIYCNLKLLQESWVLFCVQQQNESFGPFFIAWWPYFFDGITSVYVSSSPHYLHSTYKLEENTISIQIECTRKQKNLKTVCLAPYYVHKNLSNIYQKYLKCKFITLPWFSSYIIHYDRGGSHKLQQQSELLLRKYVMCGIDKKQRIITWIMLKVSFFIASILCFATNLNFIFRMEICWAQWFSLVTLEILVFYIFKSTPREKAFYKK